MAAFMKLKGEDASKAIVHPQFQPEAGRAIVHPQFQPQADGFMRLDDIKGEFSPSRELLGGSSYSPWDHDVINASDFAPATKDIGWWTVDGADFRDHNHGKRSNWDVICDVGTAIKQERVADALANPDHALGLDVGPVNQGADVWTNGSATSVKNALHSDYKPQEAVNDVGWWTVDGADFRDHNHGKRSNWDVICDIGTSIKQPTDLRANGAVHQDTPMDTHPNDNLLGYPGAGSEALTNSRTIPGDTHIPGDMYRPTNVDSNLSADALLQQVNGTIGYELQAGIGISANARGNTTGTIAAYNVMGSGVPVENHCTGHCFDGGSPVQENIFAPVNVLRSDNRF